MRRSAALGQVVHRTGVDRFRRSGFRASVRVTVAWISGGPRREALPRGSHVLRPARAVRVQRRLLVVRRSAEPHADLDVLAEPSPTQEAETPEEFVRRWVEVNTQMQNTGDTRSTARSREVPSCLETADQVEAIYEAGGYVRRMDGRSSRSKSRNRAPMDAIQLTIDVTLRQLSTRKGRGQIQTLEGGEFRELMTHRTRRRLMGRHEPGAAGRNEDASIAVRFLSSRSVYRLSRRR